jgi:hypothetical protein
MPQQTHYIIPPQFKDMTGENVKLNNILDVIKKQQEDNRLLMNRFTQQELENDILLNNNDNYEDNIILEDISNNQSELNDRLAALDLAVSEASMQERKGPGRPKKYQTEEEKKQAQRMQAFERKMKKSGGGSSE